MHSYTSPAAYIGFEGCIGPDAVQFDGDTGIHEHTAWCIFLALNISRRLVDTLYHNACRPGPEYCMGAQSVWTIIHHLYNRIE